MIIRIDKRQKNPPPPGVPFRVTGAKLYTLTLCRVEDVSVQVDLNTLILMGEGLPSTGRDDDRGFSALGADRVELLDDD